MRAGAVLALAFGFSQVASAEVLWRPSPTPYDLGAWDGYQSAAPKGKEFSRDRIAPVSSPVPGERGPVIRVTLNPGDVAYNPRKSPPYAMGNRSELIHLPYIGEGEERWYRWRVLFPKDFAVNDGKKGGAVFAQWHHWSLTGEDGSPPLLFVARTDDLRLISVPKLNSQDAITLARIPQEKGKWRDFVFHVRFSADPKKALTELWVDRVRVETQPAATLFPGYDAYLKMGLYRRPTARETNVIYFDGIVEATQRSDVEKYLADRR
jgi:hypothetical protein